MYFWIARAAAGAHVRIVPALAAAATRLAASSTSTEGALRRERGVDVVDREGGRSRVSSARPSGWKTIVSSIRLMNSGEKSLQSSFRTVLELLRLWISLEPPKPMRLRLTRCFVPMFDVMMMRVFLKSTRLP
jgi:hypothetical protein